jgi:prevent-host-death family protein
MDPSSVGIRELKTNLSKYLIRVKQGQTLIITEHGKPIGRIVPEGPSIEERLHGLALTGILLQAGGKLPTIQPVTSSRGPKLVSDLVSEDRDVNYIP